ncbi:MAG: hypothetical protein ACI4EH_00710 [Oliverpabstia sp.]
MKITKGKNVIKVSWTAGVVIVFFAMLCGWRIWNVNHTKLIEKYKARTTVYEEGTDIYLSDAIYYWDIAELDGYGMRVTNTKVMRTESFLAQYNITKEELKEISLDGESSFEKYGLIYLVTVEFWNKNWMKTSEWPILLDNFLLTGLDYFVLPATKSIHLISDFNPELDGASGFSIKSDRVFEVVLPYLIDTESEAGISLEHLVDSETKLLITLYPEESYLMLPTPTIEE